MFGIKFSSYIVLQVQLKQYSGRENENRVRFNEIFIIHCFCLVIVL